MDPTSAFGPWAELGAFGAIVVAAGLMLRQMLVTHKEDMAEHRDSIKELTKAISIQSLSIMSLYQLFLAHDLTVRGLNPSTGVDLNERANKALVVYQRCEQALKDISKSIQLGL